MATTHPSYSKGVGVTISLIPCVGMMAASIFLLKLRISEKVEATLQNFAAGIILAAVASELFPLLDDRPDPFGIVGISIGFTVGLVLVYGVDAVLDKFSESNIGGDPGIVLQRGLRPSANSSIWEFLPLQLVSEAVADPNHRAHILGHLQEMVENVDAITQISSDFLTKEVTSYSDESSASEEIDKVVHQLSYKVDHCRRLLEGHETSQTESIFESSRWPLEKKIAVHSNLLDLKKSLLHIAEHLDQGAPIDGDALQEIHGHMEDVERLLDTFHRVVESSNVHWHAVRLVVPRQGELIPMGLVVPVCVDAFVDGFLIGVSYALAPKAGIVLAAANTLEMSVLGMTLGSSLAKCTGSSLFSRRVTLVSPPLIMFTAAVFGLFLGEVVFEFDVLYSAFVGFGVVALLALVCKELLIEARQQQGEEERWYISIAIFVGIFLVILLNRFVPG